MGRVPGAVLMLLGLAATARADVPGTFVGPGTYATPDGCKKLAAIAAGGFKNVDTVPMTLTTQGLLGWDASCSFRSISEVEPGKKWKAALDCHEGAPAGPESDIFERLADGSIKVTIMGNAMTFVRCDVTEGK